MKNLKLTVVVFLSFLVLLSGCIELSDSDEAKAKAKFSELLLKLRAANLVDPEFLPQVILIYQQGGPSLVPASHP